MRTFAKFTFTFLLLFLFGKSYSQIGINATGAAPASNAMLDISSTTKGLLIPRMTTSQRNTLTATATAGLTVYDTDNQSFWYFKSPVGWTELAAGGASPWAVSGTNIHNTNTGNIGIGITNPAYPVDIQKASSTYVLNVSNLGTGSGIVSTIDGIAATSFSTKAAVAGYSNNNYGIYGYDIGNGIGIYGVSNTGTGVLSSSITGIGSITQTNNSILPAALQENLNPNGMAVQFNGGIKVGGPNRPVFQHTATAANIVGNSTEIPITTFANNVTDMLIITPIYNGVLLTKTIGVDFVGTSWRIFIQDQTNMPVGAKFNVFVVKQ